MFHPIHPHIFASASGDNTIRIWNIFGTDVERAEGDREPLSENYPQGDADEGSCLLAILAGGKAGHKAGVSALVRLSLAYSRFVLINRLSILITTH